MRVWIVFWMCMLVACAPVSEPIEQQPITQAPPAVKEQPPVPIPLQGEAATRTVKQTGSLGTFVYGLTEDNRIVRIEKTGSVWEYFYERGKLAEIKGPQSIEFLYEQNKLAAIDTGATKLLFRYDSRNRLVEVKGAQETLHVDYNTLDQVAAVRRGVAGETGFVYDNKGKLKSLARGPIITNVFFDDRDRIRNFDADDTKFILGFWRDDKLISLTGKTFGPGLTVSYGPDYPPFEALIVHAEDNSEFTSAYTNTLYTVVDDYLYCKYVRRLKEVLFDGISYAFYVNYFKGDLPGYLAMQFTCIPYEA